MSLFELISSFGAEALLSQVMVQAKASTSKSTPAKSSKSRARTSAPKASTSTAVGKTSVKDLDNDVLRKAIKAALQTLTDAKLNNRKANPSE